jgi:hypothetical protein
VDDYVADIVASDVSDDLANYDHFFTPAVVAELKQLRAELDAGGKSLSEADLDEHFRRKTQAWQEAHGN